MPVSTSYPGIYIQELPSQSHTITPAPTSVTVFIGYTHPFKTNPSAPGVSTFDGTPLEIFSFTDYERYFGGLYSPTSVDANVAFAVQQFFMNGGSVAYVVGLQPLVYDPTNGTLAVKSYFAASSTIANSDMVFSALEPTDAANPVVISFSNQKNGTTTGTAPASGYATADITITYGSRSEIFRGVSAASVATALASSTLVSVKAGTTGANASGTYPLGLFPPTAAGGTVPAVSKQTFTLDYGSTFAFPLSALAFTPQSPLPSGLSISPSTPLTITFNVQSAHWTAASGSLPSGYTQADVTITLGGTTEFYPAVTAANIVATINAGHLVTASAPGGWAGPLPPLGNASNSTVTSISQSFPLVTLTPSFRASDFEAVMQAGTALDKLSVFNLLVVPGISDAGVLSTAVAFAEGHRAFLIMDAPAQNDDGSLTNLTVENVVQAGAIGTAPLDSIPLSVNAALYYPYLSSPNPLVSGATIRLPPSGFVAGVYARIDQSRGVWKAPAGLETSLVNATSVVPEGVMIDMQQGVLNGAGINALRTFAGQGTVVFGARTVLGANNDTAYQQWRYVPVRRMALFIEQTLYANLGWAVFEPNDVPLWNAMKASVERFMLSLFRQGAFQGTTPSDAFVVKCDASTTTQTDIDNGAVNLLVGFAPLKPAEFVVIQITQLTAQAS